jgi:ubiquitin-conjugating enzyme E2 variant
VGGQIAAFQGHHQRPWTITEREFANNVHKVFKPAAPVAAAMLAASAAAPPAAAVFASSFLFLACMSQQFHAWSHMKRSELHPLVVAAQEGGLLISRRAHGAHHKAPFEGNYCIVSGLWNGVLDRDGADDAFFRVLERAIHARWGVEPRCWHEPGVGWEELQR